MSTYVLVIDQVWALGCCLDTTADACDSGIFATNTGGMSDSDCAQEVDTWFRRHDKLKILI